MTALTQLYLNHTALSGEVPSSLLNLVQLTKLDIRYNMLSVSDPALVAFLTAKNPGWLNTQTAAPRNLHAQALSDTVVQLTWDALPYTEDGGGYRLNYGTTSGGPYSQEIAISNKITNRFNINGLTPGTTYYFVLLAYTPAHGKQQNELLSPKSQEASALPSLSPISWVVMVYLNGDNDLDQWTFNLFNQLEKAVYLDRTLIVRVLWDRSRNGDTVLYQVQPDNHDYGLGTYAEGENKWLQGELNMGSPNTLLNFITSTREVFPGKHDLLSIVDHGGGWSPKLLDNQPPKSRYVAGASGFSWDWTNQHGYLSTQDMRFIFTQQELVDNPIDIVFYDACLMSMLEEAYALRNGARYLVASQNETWTSFPYAAYLTDIGSRTAEAQAIWMVDKYYASLNDYPRTMSALDLQYTSAISKAVDSLALALLESIPTSKAQIQEVFSTTQKLDYNYDLKIDPQEGYVDLGDFSVKLFDKFPNTNIANAAQHVQAVLHVGQNSFVLHERHQSGKIKRQGPQINLDRVTGLSIYLPLGEDDPELLFYTKNQLDFAADTLWDDFIFKIKLINVPQAPGPKDFGGRGHSPQPQTIESLIYLPFVMSNRTSEAR